MSVSRRVFVKSGGLALVSLGLDPLFRAPAAFASYRPLPSSTALSRPILVCLFQRGAVDGLNMIVPHGDPVYYRERPRIAVPEKDVLDLDGYFGLHPRLAPIKPLWDSKSLAAIHAIGSPDATRSHFDAQDYLESGTPGVKATPDGWLNRYCQHDREHQDTPFRASRSTTCGRSACARHSRPRATGSPAPSRSCTPAPRPGCSRHRPGRRSRPSRCSSAWTRASTDPRMRPTIRAGSSEKPSSRSPSSSRPTSGSRWRSRTSRGGIHT